MQKQCFNPFLPPWEYIPDGEPYVFDDRVYVYGSHDDAQGYVFCQNDYVCYSADVHDLSDWRYEGVIYKKTQDPYNPDGHMNLYAPDVTKGPDGRYYLYYVLDKVNVVSVAVCDTPAGSYHFYGYVRHADGSLLGARAGDEPQFDPGVLTEGDVTYLYTGLCVHGDASRSGAMGMTLGTDMLTLLDEPVIVVPGNCYGQGTDFEGHEYFEAASIRKIGDVYYFIYSSTSMHELCYATSKHPLKDFKYGGVIVSNCDVGIDTYKPGALPMNVTFGNNHGSLCLICDAWYIFYHRHTNGTWFSRQACMERIHIGSDGHIKQVEITSQGAGAPLIGRGEYPATIACNVFSVRGDEVVSNFKAGPLTFLPKITSDGREGDEDAGFVIIPNEMGVGFKYFECRNVSRITVKTRGYNRGVFEVKTQWDGALLGSIPIVSSNIWTDFTSEIAIPDGVHALYFIYKGTNQATLGSFTLE